MPVKIVLTGPESSGKTTLAQALSQQWPAPLVTEYARTYLATTGGMYSESDLLDIARGQYTLEQIRLAACSDLIVCDTDLLVIAVWSHTKYGRCDPWIEETLLKNPGDLYLLCSPDFPWQYDPLREHPQLRQELYTMYLNRLNRWNLPFVEISGDPLSRLRQSMNLIQVMI